MTSMIGLLGWFGTIWMMGVPSAEAKKRKEPQPCWVTQPCDPYDANAYMIGVGSGSTLEDADAAAMGALSRQFSVQITQRQTSVKDTSETNRGSKSISESDHQRLRTETGIESQITLEHVNVASHWLRTSTKDQPERHYALAVIPRAEWLRQIDQERNTLSLDISKLKMQIQQQSTLYDKLPHYRSLLPLLDQDVALYNRRQIVDVEQRSMPPTSTRQQLILNVEQQRRTTTIVLPQNTPYRSMVSESLSELGMTIVAVPTRDAEASVVCATKQVLHESDAYQFIKVNTHLQCTVTNAGQVLHEVELIGKASSRNAEKAQQQSIQALSTELTALYTTMDTLWSL
jgi:hypothetical protein